MGVRAPTLLRPLIEGRVNGNNPAADSDDKRAVGATAHVLTTFRADGPKQGRYRVAGRLLLTKDHGRWTVFGYHVNKGGR